MICLVWSLTNLKNLVKILRWFYLVSRLRINVIKRKFYRVSVQEEEIQVWARSLGNGWGTIPFTYLCVSIGESMRRLDSWKQTIEKVKKKQNFVVKSATLHCLELFYETAPPSRVKMYLDRDLKSSLSI
ncbi:hypothetical protein OSB04_025340 [Centaurea solstitialis]|uniref:Uncharacterized protein n=1 Tax=Centaurea solstitialis TaxID=347529 RepID=A0AA38T7B1_9ASTR|nr:hypothetical protein OSB04_025340 [Centaurea solstitialis]